MSEQDASARLRILFALLAAFSVFPLIGAVNTLAPPVLVIYPLTVGSGIDPETGASIAVLLAQKIAQTGDIVVKPYPPGTKRQDYLTAAVALGADYYVTGFLTPLGDQVSLITQVVFVSSGTVVTSATTVVKTFADAGGQADFLHDAILHHAGRALASLDKPPTTDTPAPKPSSKDEANLSGLFKRKKKAPAAPTASPSQAVATPQGAASVAARTDAAAVRPTPRSTLPPAPRTPLPTPRPTARPTRAPSSTAVQVAVIGAEKPLPLGLPVARLKTGATALVLDVTGGVDAALDGYAQDALVAALQRGGVAAASLPANPAELPTRAGEYCAAAFGTKTLYVPKLTVDRNADGHPNGVELDVTTYDCGGAPTGRQQTRARAGRGGVNAALDFAASAAVSGFTFANQSR